MKFEGIYETLQKVAIGPVVTLVARDKTNNQRVIVHSFEYSEQAINQPTMREVLSAFSALAPQPVASVIDAGRFNGTSFAYLVTSWPGDEALAEWVRLYEAGLGGERTSQPSGAATVISGSGPAGLPMSPEARPAERPDFGAQTATRYSPTTVPPGTPGAVSGFWGRREDTTSPNPAEVVPRAPGAFTKEFFPQSADEPGSAPGPFVAKANGPASNQHSGAIPVDQRPIETEYNKQASSPLSSIAASEKGNEPFPKLSAPLMEAVEAGQFTDLFFKRIEPEEGVASPDIDERDKGGTGGGEFTSFFKGPFSGEWPAPTPTIDVDSTPHEKVPGDFTSVFGSSEREALSKPQPFLDYQSPNSAAQGSSTEIFRPQEISAPNDPFALDWQPRQQSSAAPRDFTRPADRIANAAASQHPAADPLIDREPFRGTGSVHAPAPMSPLPDAPSNATRVFSSRDAGLSMDQPAEPTGPSPWTIFQKSEKAAALPSEEAAVAPSSQERTWGGINAVVPSPVAPAIPSLQAPVVSARVPQQVPISMPQPAIAMPVVPLTPPQPAPAPKPAFSYWPLVIVLNVLFIIAVLLILYFALKH